MASQVSTQSTENLINASQNHSINTNNSLNNSHPFGNTYSLAQNNNGPNLLLSSSQILASMPSIVAAAVAGITTFHQNNQSLLPMNQVQCRKDSFSSVIPESNETKNNTSSETSPAGSSSSSRTSSPLTAESPEELNNKV